jgi:tetratricopeptide (TPR) repeat protein
MADRPLLSATLIARDEKHNIKRCFDSFWDDVDQVVLLDTGSKDGTIAEARRYAQRKKQTGKLIVGRFKWIDDFAAARQAADDLATGAWLVWLDLDDTIEGLGNLRETIANAPDDVLAYFCQYTYALDEDQNTISELWRERIVRNCGLPWQGRLHEHKSMPPGVPIIKVPPETTRWVHHRDHAQRQGASERNLRILTEWAQQSPDDPRVLASLGMEYMGVDKHKEASDAFARYLQIPGEPPDRRSQSARHMCVMLIQQGRYDEARIAALQSVAENWLWADSHLSLAEAEQALGRPDVALSHARQALAIGKPDTLLIVNPMQYEAHTRALIALCLAQMGRWEDAVEAGREALRISPSNGLMLQQMPMYQGHLKRERTLGATLALAELMAEHGELVKATRLLDEAPYFVAEDPRLVARKAQLAQAIAGRQAQPVVVEDEAADKFIERHLQGAA